MKKNHAAASVGLARSVVTGLSVSCATAAAAMGVIALLIYRESLPILHVGIIVQCLHFIVLFAGCFVAGFAKKEKLLYTCGVILAIVYVMCIGMTMLMFGVGFGGFFGNIVPGILGAVCAFLVHVKRRGIGRRRFLKRKIC